MKRFITLIALAGAVGVSFGAVPRSSGETGYVPKPTFTLVKSQPLLPGYEFKLVGLEWVTWVNEFTAPCRVEFVLGTDQFSVKCDKEEYLLEVTKEGGKYTVRIKPKE